MPLFCVVMCSFHLGNGFTMRFIKTTLSVMEIYRTIAEHFSSLQYMQLELKQALTLMIFPKTVGLNVK